jgi:hypothetical protein
MQSSNHKICLPILFLMTLDVLEKLRLLFGALPKILLKGSMATEQHKKGASHRYDDRHLFYTLPETQKLPGGFS